MPEECQSNGNKSAISHLPNSLSKSLGMLIVQVCGEAPMLRANSQRAQRRVVADELFVLPDELNLECNLILSTAFGRLTTALFKSPQKNSVQK